MLYCLTAVTTPMITAMNAAMITEGITIRSVIPSRLQSSGPTGWPVVLVPKLPVSMCVSQVQ